MDDRSESSTATTCGYCGVGCRLEAHVAGGELVSITPGAREGPANRGHACLKGRFAHRFASSPDRLRRPLIRSGGELREVSWEEAIATIADRLGAIKDEPRPRRDRGPGVVAGDQRGLLRDGPPDARGDRDQQHRQLLPRVPLPHLLRPPSLVRALGGDRFVLRHRHGAGGDHRRRQPHPGPPRRRGEDQAGRPARPEAGDDRPAADRAGRLRGAASRPPAGHQRRRDARAGTRAGGGRPPRPPLHRRAHRGQRGRAGAARAVHAGGGPGDQRHSGGGHRTGGPPVRGGHRGVDHLGAGGNRAQVRLGGRAADLQPRDADRQGRQARLGPASAAGPEQRPGLIRHGRPARHPQRLPPRQR